MRFEDINQYNLPIYTIICANLNSPRDIIDFFTKKRIDRYIYEISIVFNGKLITIKFGMSADNGRDFGDRTYRQMAHLKSWGAQRILGSSGADFVVVNDLWRVKYNCDIDHKLCLIKIWDLTNYPFKTLDPREEILAFEEIMIWNYENTFGEKPIGNLLEKYSHKDKAIIEKLTLQRIFDGLVD